MAVLTWTTWKSRNGERRGPLTTTSPTGACSGAVSLSSEHNVALNEKAGREGFTQGRAYSDFKGLLINLFEELAATFFRATSPQVEAYEKGRERLKREDALRKERDRRAKAGRRRLRAQLAGAVQFLNETNFQQQAAEIVQTLATELDSCDRLQPRLSDCRRSEAGIASAHNVLGVRRAGGVRSDRADAPGHDGPSNAASRRSRARTSDRPWRLSTNWPRPPRGG